MSRPNSPHKLTKPPSLGSAAEPPSGGSELHARVTSAADRSCRALVAAAVVSLSRGRRGGRLLQLRVIALGAPRWDANKYHVDFGLSRTIG